MVLELSVWSGKSAKGEKQPMCNKQLTMSKARSAGCSRVSFKPWYWHEVQFLVSGVTTKLIPSSDTPGEDISLWPEILPFQHGLPTSVTYFWQSCQKFLHKLCIGHQQEPPFKQGPSSGEGVVKKVVSFPVIALNPALHLKPLFIKEKKPNKASWQQMIKADSSGPPKPWSGVLDSNRRAK